MNEQADEGHEHDADAVDPSYPLLTQSRLAELLEEVEDEGPVDRILDAKLMFYFFAVPAEAPHLFTQAGVGTGALFAHARSAPPDKKRKRLRTDRETLEFKDGDRMIAMDDANVPRLTGLLQSARRFCDIVFPNWFASSGLCALTGHASIGPDYNGHKREDLMRQFPEDDFHEGFHADLKPGDGPHRECRAILSCVIQAKVAHMLMRDIG